MEFRKGIKVVRIYGDDYPEHNMFKGNIYTVEKHEGVDLFLQEIGLGTRFAPDYFQISKESNIKRLLNKIDSCD